ncbi:hypothetical protein [Kitasatospora sp. CB01950]|uniref:hypothetical protein n=1 Tax=Kitasatospora sp. CB01950 TaxID=1703930 RepID=UPI00093DB430|nr:hypothetical protein [Kitasatospora sp. CB01950]OKJ06809.1 hypothetical protein AMK19_23430 [Kitasatospora sp. CB01950]
MTTDQPTARQTLFAALTDPPEQDADIIGLPDDQAHQLLDAYRDQVLDEIWRGVNADIIGQHRAQVREEVAAEIDAAADRTVAEYPDEPAMSVRVLGLRAAARIARAVQEG